MKFAKNCTKFTPTRFLCTQKRKKSKHLFTPRVPPLPPLPSQPSPALMAVSGRGTRVEADRTHLRNEARIRAHQVGKGSPTSLSTTTAQRGSAWGISALGSAPGRNLVNLVFLSTRRLPEATRQMLVAGRCRPCTLRGCTLRGCPRRVRGKNSVQSVERDML